MNNFTPREKIIFDTLKRRKSATTNDLMDALREGGVKIPKTKHHTMTLSLKYLSFKVAQQGWIIRRIEGGQGRGHIARYAMEKEF